MRLVTLRYWITIVVTVWGLFTRPAFAGGPLQFNEQDGKAYRWPFDTAVYVVEGGRLGIFNNQQLKETVDRAFNTWVQVPTAGLFAVDLVTLPNLISPDRLAPFQKDITVDDFVKETCALDGSTLPRLECELFTACNAQNGIACPSPIIFDDPKDCSANSQENSIIKEFFGGDNTVIGFTTPFLTLGPSPQLPPELRNTVVQAFVVLSGCFFTEESLKELNAIDPDDGRKFVESVLTHEFGHFVGLAHTSVNGDIVLANGLSKKVKVGNPQLPRGPQAPVTLGKLDPLTSIDASAVETMFPINLTAILQPDPVTQNTLEQDDRFALSTIYPCTDASAKKQAGLCKPLSEGTGTISGNVFMLQVDPNTGTLVTKAAQGVLVIARRIDDDGKTTAPGQEAVLKQAISQFTGNTFAPQRCSGQINFDKENDGTTDLSLAGVFGPCTTTEQCTTELNATDGLIPRLSEIINGANNITTTTGKFVGSCGFTSAGSSAPNPVGDAREASFSLEGLSPGSYIVQALPVVCPDCGFSSPIRSSLGAVDFINAAFSNPPSSAQTASSTPIIQSDDNQFLTGFPNPQIGENYNGPATGCSSTTPPCGDETASSADNPFAYTPIVVTAGNQVKNINIFLNTASSSIFSDPGLNFCLLADTNGDGKVNQEDILAVSKEQASFAKKQKIKNFRADVNRDNAVTLIDVDLITDLVSIPRPFDNPASGIVFFGNSSELKRGIAPFDAICAAAKAGGCEIQGPAEDIQDNGKPSDFTCGIAREGGCKVTGCQ